MRLEKPLRLNAKLAALIALAHVVIGWSLMRLLAIAEAGFDMEKAANIRLYGAVLVLPIFYYAFAQKTGRSIPLMMDVAAVCVIFGAISGRFNCFTKGCCQGVLFPGAENFRWPIREAELIYYAVFFVYYAGKILKKKTHGQVYPVYLLSYGILRFLCECFRVEYTAKVGIFHQAHIWSLIAIAAGAILLFKHRHTPSPRHRCANKSGTDPKTRRKTL